MPSLQRPFSPSVCCIETPPGRGPHVLIIPRPGPARQLPVDSVPPLCQVPAPHCPSPVLPAVTDQRTRRLFPVRRHVSRPGAGGAVDQLRYQWERVAVVTRRDALFSGSTVPPAPSFFIMARAVTRPPIALPIALILIPAAATLPKQLLDGQPFGIARQAFLYGRRLVLFVFGPPVQINSNAHCFPPRCLCLRISPRCPGPSAAADPRRRSQAP